MKNLLIISLVILLTSCSTLKQGGKALEESKGESKGHAGAPMTTFLGDTNLEEVIAKSDFTGKARQDLELLRSAFLENTKLDERELTGHAKLIFDGLGSIVRERSRGVSETPPNGTHKECIDAYAEKYAWHLENNGAVPATFGKITEYVLTPAAVSDHWVGAIDLCTWIGDTNYYFNISFLEKKSDSLSLKRPPFGDFIDNLTDDDTEGFNYKLHVRGEKVADQLGYCMGRCDGIVMNTGK